MSGIESSNRKNKLISENEFIYDGVTYVAQESDGGCEGCAFIEFICGNMRAFRQRPDCISYKRSDEREVIFIKKSERATVKGTTTMIDFTKPIQTRDGKPVRILCTDGPVEDYPIIGLVDTQVMLWTSEGHYFSDKLDEKRDLIQVEEKPTPRPHADLIIKWANDATMRIKYLMGNKTDEWRETQEPGWYPDHEYEEILPGDPLF